MVLTRQQKQILALSALLQSSYLVYQLGTEGDCDQRAFEININSIYALDAPNFISIYGSTNNLKLGLEVLIDLFQNKTHSKTYKLLNRYTFDAIFLQQLLTKQTDLMELIRKRLNQAIRQRTYFVEINDTILDNLADIYCNSVSQLQYKIHVIGRAKYMHNPKIFNKIRALLLSSIRASMLWRQLGGNKWQLFFSKNKILREAKSLLNIAN